MSGTFRPSDRCSTSAAPPPGSGPWPPVTTPYARVKRAADLVLAAILAVVLTPVVLVTAALVVLTSRGPAFYTQVRLGRFGKPFVLWKLRTMAHDCERRSGPRWSGPGDVRVTRLGRVLRRLHVDEVPQLWNVLRGEMSLVGPRPERPEFFPVLSAAVPDYPRRLRARPGVTGLAQVYLPPDEDVADVRRKQLYDLYYLRSLSLGLDLRLLAATALRALGARHGVVRRLLRLPTPEEIESDPSATGRGGSA